MSSYFEARPCAALAHVVERFWFGGETDEPHYEILPDGCTDMVFELGPSAHNVLLFGTTTRSTLFPIVRDTQYVGVRFRPGSVGTMLDCDAAPALTDRCLEIGALPGLSIGQLADESKFAARWMLLERYLLRRLPHTGPSRVQQAVQLIEDSGGQIRLPALAGACHYSIRQLERRFLAEVGVSPKAYGRFVRFRQAAARLTSQTALDFAQVAAELGYTDQAHFIRDFKSLTGRTPGRFDAAQARL